MIKKAEGRLLVNHLKRAKCQKIRKCHWNKKVRPSLLAKRKISRFQARRREPRLQGLQKRIKRNRTIANNQRQILRSVVI